MVFSSLLFLFRYLPIVLILYFIVPKRFKNFVLFAASLIFYAWDTPLYVFIMLFSTFFDYTIGRCIEKCYNNNNKKGAKIFVLASVVVNLGILGFFKYYDFAIETINSIFSCSLPVLEIGLPIGISFYTFQTLSYSIDVYRGKVSAQHNIISFGAYVAMFPQLIAGPIVQYKTIENQINNRSLSVDNFSIGIERFIAGLGKKVLLANTIGELFSEISSLESGLTTATAWLGIIAFTFQIYFDFSGYSDMAVGLGRMLGFNFLENFDYPYESKSITEFWRRWHISLGTFFREYVYIPLGGNRKGRCRQLLNLFIVWMLTGLWHGASWNFVLWGLYYAVILILEKLFLLKLLDKIPKVFRHIYSLILIVIGWAIFSYSDMSDGMYYIKTMFGLSGEPFADSQTVYLLGSFAVILAACIIGSTSIPKRICTKIFENKKIKPIAFNVFQIVIFVLCVMLLVSQSYNPFLYFRF